MINRVMSLFCALLFMFSAIQTINVVANTIDSQNECNLTLCYSINDKDLNNQDVKIYRIAKINSDGLYEILSPFSAYPVSVNNISSQNEWKEVASTIDSYIDADKLQFYSCKKIGIDGKVTFENIQTGLYFVSSVTVNNKNKLRCFDGFMMQLPYYQNDEYVYDVVANPKSSDIAVEDKETKYTILKLWKDLENKNRPGTVKVDILKNGIVQKTIKLSAKNNWIYSFVVKGNKDKWTVVERNIPKDYRVRIIKNKTSFLLINTHKNNESDNKKPPYSNSPKTGVTLPLMFYGVVMCVSGLILIIIGIVFLRGKKK